MRTTLGPRGQKPSPVYRHHKQLDNFDNGIFEKQDVATQIVLYK